MFGRRRNKQHDHILNHLKKIEECVVMILRMELKMSISLDGIKESISSLEGDVEALKAAEAASVAELGELAQLLRDALANVTDPNAQAEIDGLVTRLSGVHAGIVAAKEALDAANVVNDPTPDVAPE